MACAQQLARAGHDVHVYERWAKAGGLLRYGIPDFKMEKIHVDRRVEQMQAEGVTFHYGVDVGVNVPVEQLVKEHDAVVLAGGAEKPRDLPIPGRELKGIHFAMDFLPQQNRRVSGEPQTDASRSWPTGKQVVVIGGGDTGSDCIGTSIRQGAALGHQFRDHAAAAGAREQAADLAGLAVEAAHLVEPRGRRRRAISPCSTQKFAGENGHVKKLHCVHVDGKFQPMPGSEFEIEADLVLLAMGFVHPVHEGMLQSARRRARPARQCQGRHRRLRDLGAQGICRRRHAARPVAGGLGDPRRPPVRARGRRIPDGLDHAAALGALPLRPESASMDLSYSQNMEDWHLWLAFGGGAAAAISISAPAIRIADNVSFFFYERGWQGIVVEPQQKLIDLYARLRPRDIAVCGLIGTRIGPTGFHVFDAFHGLSTTNTKYADAAATLGDGYRTVTVPTVSLAQLCERQGLRDIDFLKIDVEGAEADVLRSNDWDRFRPKAIVVEAIAPGTNEPAWQEWEPFLLAQRYRFMLFDTLNRFYVAEEQPEIAARFPKERAPWDAVTHMYEIGRAPENQNHPEHALTRVLARGFWPLCLISTGNSSPIFSRAAACRRTRARSSRRCAPWTRKNSAPGSAASPAATTAGKSSPRTRPETRSNNDQSAPSSGPCLSLIAARNSCRVSTCETPPACGWSPWLPTICARRASSCIHARLPR